MDVRRTAGVLATTLLVGLGAGLPLLAAGPGSAAPTDQVPRCRGVPATIVGSGRLHGTPGDDVIVATGPDTRVWAGKGDDLVCGAGIVRGQAGNDQIHYRGPVRGKLYILGGPGDDVIRFHGKQDFRATGRYAGVYGGPGADLMVGAKGSLWFHGGWGDDHLVSGPGGDSLDGGGGDDLLLGGSGQDALDGGPGDDLLRGRRGSDELAGGPGRDRAWAGPGKDWCFMGKDPKHGCELDRSDLH